ncbi:hypothetical protein OROMI_023994 [Orobanche minor]
MPSQEILKIRDGTPLEAEEILTYIKKPSKRIEILKIRDDPRNGSFWYFSSKLDVPSNVVQKKRVARILFFKIRPSQEILRIRDGTHLEAEEISTYIKNPQNGSIWYFSSKLDVLSNVVQKKRVARILFFKIRPSQEILKIRDGTPFEAEEILTYIKKPSKWTVAPILFFKIRLSQEILKIRDGTPLEAEEILTYIKKTSKRILDVPSNVVQKKRVARILFFKIRPSQEILRIRDGTHLEAEEISTYIKNPQNGSIWYFSSKLDVPSNVVQKKRVARILFFKIRPSQEILKIRDGTPLEAEEILTYIKKPSKWTDLKRVARILFFKIRPSQEILKIRDGTLLEAEEILTYIKRPSKWTDPRNGPVWYFSSKLDVPSNVVQKKRVAPILFSKIRPSQEILKIRDSTPLEAEEILTYIKKPSKWIAEEILTYIKSPRNGSVWYFYNKLDIPINVVQKKRVARIMFFKIGPSQEILRIRDSTHLEMPSQEILKIRDGTPMEAEEILTYIKSPQNGMVWYFSSKLYVPSNVVQKKRVAWILFFKIRPSQEILKIRDGTHLEAEEILTYIKKLSKCIGTRVFLSVARILFFKIRPSQEILKIRDGTPLEAEEILTYIKKPSKWTGLKKRVARIMFFKIGPSQEILRIRDSTHLEMPSQEILKIRDGTPMEAEEILTYIKSPQNGMVWYFSSKLYVPSNVVQKKRVAWILFFKIRPSQEILKIRDGTHLEAEEILTYIKKLSKCIGTRVFLSVQKKRVARILFFKIRPSQEILKIRDVQKKRVARILFFKIRPSQEILRIRDSTPLEAEEILTYIKALKMDWFVARILFSKIRPSQEILKIRDSTPLEAEEILTYIKNPRNGSVCNVVQKKRVARILFFKIRPSQEILKIRDVQKKRVARILFFKIRPSQEILRIRDSTPLEAEEILTYIKSPQNGLVWYFSSKLYVPSNVVQKKRVARILFSKIKPSQEILKIRDSTPLEAEEILTYIKNPQNGSVWYFSSKLDVPSNVVQKKRVARPRNGSIWYFYNKLDVPINVVQKKRVARILFFKIRPSQEILRIRDSTPLEAEEILTYIKSPQNGLVWYFSSKLYVPSNVVQKKRVARILFSKIRPSQEILKIRDSTPLEAEEILTYIKNPRNGSVWYFSSKLDVPSNVVQKKRVARILFFKIRPSQEILRIRDSTPLEAEEILTYIKSPQNGLVWYFSSKLYVPSNVVQKKRVARILFSKIRPSQEILKIRDSTPLEAEEILTYIKNPRNGSVWYFSSKLDVPSNVKKRVARILFFKIRPSQEILRIRDSTPLEAEEILTYIKSPQNGLVWPSQEILKIRDSTPLEAEEILTYIKNPRNGSAISRNFKNSCPFGSGRNFDIHKKSPRNGPVWPSQEILKIRDSTPLELDVPINVVQKKRVARILVFKIRPSQEILRIRDSTPLEAEEILTYIKSPQNGLVWYFSSKLYVPSNVVQKKRVARILFSKIRPSQEILKIRDSTPLEAEEILTYIKNTRNGSVWYFSSKLDVPSNVNSPRNGPVWYFSSKLDVPSNVVQKKRVAPILFSKIRPSQEILKIRDIQKKRVARILVFKIRPSQEILRIRDSTPLEAEEILTYIKSPQNGLVWYFSSKLYVPSNVVQKKRVARILFSKIRPSQEILKIRDSTPLEAEEILTYIKNTRNGSVWYFSSKLDVPSNVV